MGGATGKCVFRSDGSLWLHGDYSGLAKYTGLDFLSNIKFRTQALDDGSKSGGV